MSVNSLSVKEHTPWTKRASYIMYSNNYTEQQKKRK